MKRKPLYPMGWHARSDAVVAMAYAFEQMNQQARAASKAMDGLKYTWWRMGHVVGMVHDSVLVEAYSQRPIYRDDVWGWDWGHLALRLHWYENHGWPRIVKDQWCWHFVAGPIYLSGHRGKFLP